MDDDITSRFKYRIITDVADIGMILLDYNRGYKGMITLLHLVASIAILLMPAFSPNFAEVIYGPLPSILIFGLTAMFLSVCLFASEADLVSYTYLRNTVYSGQQAAENDSRGFLNVVKNMSSTFFLKMDTLVFPAAIGFVGALAGMTAAWVYCSLWTFFYFGVGFLVLGCVAYGVFKWRINEIIRRLKKIA